MDFDFAVIGDNWRFLAYGVWITILLSAVSGFTSLAAGLVIALLRLYCPGWLRVPIVLYIDSMRAIPVLVVLVWTFFALPIVAGVTMSPFTAALIGLTVHLAAYAAEIVRAGIESVRPGQSAQRWRSACPALRSCDASCFRRKSCACCRHSAR